MFSVRIVTLPGSGVVHHTEIRSLSRPRVRNPSDGPPGIPVDSVDAFVSDALSQFSHMMQLTMMNHTAMQPMVPSRDTYEQLLQLDRNAVKVSVPDQIFRSFPRRKASNKTEENSTCTVCLENFGDNVLVQLPCGHLFHEMCIEPWMKQHKSCPSCRRDCTVPPPAAAAASRPPPPQRSISTPRGGATMFSTSSNGSGSGSGDILDQHFSGAQRTSAGPRRPPPPTSSITELEAFVRSNQQAGSDFAGINSPRPPQPQPPPTAARRAPQITPQAMASMRPPSAGSQEPLLNDLNADVRGRRPAPPPQNGRMPPAPPPRRTEEADPSSLRPSEDILDREFNVGPRRPASKAAGRGPLMTGMQDPPSIGAPPSSPGRGLRPTPVRSVVGVSLDSALPSDGPRRHFAERASTPTDRSQASSLRPRGRLPPLAPGGGAPSTTNDLPPSAIASRTNFMTSRAANFLGMDKN